MSLFDILAEQRIVDAIRRGELDNLPGAGRPLNLEEEPFVSSGQRMLNTILCNAGVAPSEISLRKELATLRGELEHLPDGPARTALRQRIALIAIQLSEMPRGRRSEHGR